MQRTRMVLLFSVVLLMLVSPLAYGQTASPDTSKPASGGQTASPPNTGIPASPDTSKPSPQGDQWQFRVTPYLWAAQIEAKATIGGYSSTVNVYFPELLSHLEGGAMVNFEAQKGKLGFFIDPLALKVRGDGDFTRTRSLGLIQPPTRNVTLTLSVGMVEFGGFYQVLKWPLDWKQGSGRAITVDVLAGGRYWYFQGDLDTTSPINPTAYNNWVDPIMGARTKIDLTDKFMLNLEGDFGGFGVGSKFTWNAQGSFGYQFTPRISAFAGYRILYIDYKGASSRVGYNVTMEGPTAGATFTF
ncbi:MAG TPA: hypothetical protein VKF36_01325 [Syntrophorhabdales bacterium]|nr:hypothetical protein [Syntrophorhabdales bacterium]